MIRIIRRFIYLSVIIFLAIFYLLTKDGVFRNSKNILLRTISRKVNGNQNTFSLKNYGFEVDSLKIYWVSEKSKTLLFYDNKFHDVFEDTYGRNNFLIYYGKKLVFSDGHWKYNRRYSHDYNFIITYTDSIMQTTLSILGPNGTALKKEFDFSKDTLVECYRRK